MIVKLNTRLVWIACSFLLLFVVACKDDDNPTGANDNNDPTIKGYWSLIKWDDGTFKLEQSPGQNYNYYADDGSLYTIGGLWAGQDPAKAEREYVGKWKIDPADDNYLIITDTEGEFVERSKIVELSNERLELHTETLSISNKETIRVTVYVRT